MHIIFESEAQKWDNPRKRFSTRFYKYLASAVALNICWSKFLASPIERMWFQRPRPCTARSLSSASESCEAIALRAFKDMFSMFSKEAILAILTVGDMDNNLINYET